jgi:hypothetical protein
VRYSSGADVFTLGPRSSREIRLRLAAGSEFNAEDVRAAGDDLRIRIRTLVDGSIIGGMSFALDLAMKRPPNFRPPKHRDRLDELAEHLLGSLDLQHREVRSIDVTHVVIDIELGDRRDDEPDDY